MKAHVAAEDAISSVDTQTFEARQALERALFGAPLVAETVQDQRFSCASAPHTMAARAEVKLPPRSRSSSYARQERAERYVQAQAAEVARVLGPPSLERKLEHRRPAHDDVSIAASITKHELQAVRQIEQAVEISHPVVHEAEQETVSNRAWASHL